jgi:hypothetical protein
MNKLRYYDKTLAEFSTLDVGEVAYTKQLHALQKQPNFELKTWAKQLFRLDSKQNILS